VSVRRIGDTTLGTRCEIKNLNSLRSLLRAVDHEAERQSEMLAAGGRIVQETRHWDEGEAKTVTMRSKEEAYDYRYFPEPDLVPVVPDAELLAAARGHVGVMPVERRRRLVALVGADGTAEQIQTVIELDLDELVLATVAAGAEARLALTRTANEAAAKAEGSRSLDPGSFAALLRMEAGGKLSATQAKTVLGELIDSGGEPAEIARRLGFEAMESTELDGVLDELIAAHPAEWDRYCAGDPKMASFLMGQVMKLTKGRADGRVVAEALGARKG
jgi:aspartyl-tRNA(Asn)/glutamyl-tRNA(Gln) amidotransferase subunit B